MQTRVHLDMSLANAAIGLFAFGFFLMTVPLIGTHPVKAAYRTLLACEIVCPLIFGIRGKPNDDYG